jgi:hypothetical protein
MQADHSIMATSNLNGNVKVYKLKENEGAELSEMASPLSFPPGPNQKNGPYSIELMYEFKDHFFPVNDI